MDHFFGIDSAPAATVSRHSFRLVLTRNYIEGIGESDCSFSLSIYQKKFAVNGEQEKSPDRSRYKKKSINNKNADTHIAMKSAVIADCLSKFVSGSVMRYAEGGGMSSTTSVVLVRAGSQWLWLGFGLAWPGPGLGREIC